MRAVRFDGTSVTLQRQWRDPVPGPGEALVRPVLTGVCSSDTEIARGGTTFTGTLGHEFVGVVEDVNIPAGAPSHLQEKKSLKGRRVVGSINIVCGKCDMCKRGLSPHCRSRTVLGIAGRDGVFADRFTIPAASAGPCDRSMTIERNPLLRKSCKRPNAATMRCMPPKCLRRPGFG